MKAEVKRIESILRPLGTPETAEGTKAYLKSDLEFLGVMTPDRRQAATEWLRTHPGLDRRRFLDLVEALWATRGFDLRAFGVELLDLGVVRSSGELRKRMQSRSGSLAHL